jgi:hypothetical protein
VVPGYLPVIQLQPDVCAAQQQLLARWPKWLHGQSEPNAAPIIASFVAFQQQSTPLTLNLGNESPTRIEH